MRMFLSGVTCPSCNAQIYAESTVSDLVAQCDKDGEIARLSYSPSQTEPFSIILKRLAASIKAARPDRT